MAIGLPPDTLAQLGDWEAEALFEEAREIERRRRRRRLVGASAIAAIALVAGIGFGMAGGGGRPSVSRRSSGGAGLSASKSHQPRVFRGTAVASASVCMPASQPATAADPPPGQCVTMLPNGRRYQCPIGVENSFADAMQAATNGACRGLAPPAIPAVWRPTIVQMTEVKACLQRAGLTVGGSATPPSAQRAYRDTPIAALLIAGSNARPTTVSFYLTTTQARQAYERTLATVTRQGQRMARQGRVLYAWNNQAADQASTERGCVEGAR
jgi:hypothetical protein